MLIQDIMHQIQKEKWPYSNYEDHHFAVNLILQDINQEAHLLYQLRTQTLRAHPGEISFPGGRSEPDDHSFYDTAVRESCEELGIKQEDIHFLAELDTLILPFNGVIHPYLTCVEPSLVFDDPSPNEVDDIFMVPIAYLQRASISKHTIKLTPTPPDNFPYEKVYMKEDYQFKTGSYDTYFFSYKQYHIWGITAKITIRFLQRSGLLI